MSKEKLHRYVKQFVYQIIMTFKEYRGDTNEALITEIIQSATRMSARCREACETEDENKIQSGLLICKDFLAEILYLLNLLEHTNTLAQIKTENLFLEAMELKLVIEKLYENSPLMMEV